jgi:hypothetical protein
MDVIDDDRRRRVSISVLVGTCSSSVIDNMASIATSLWDSIFTPGPTPILIKAMNLSFIALFALLVPLIFVTKNIHVFFLTILGVGLWIGMQWCSQKYRSLIVGF